MVFVFDLDDTICDSDGYSECYIKEFIKQKNLPIKQIAKDVRYAEMKFSWSEIEARAWYYQYGDQMMLEFPCKKNTVEIINKLHSLGHKIVIATARDKNWHCQPEEITLQWIENVGLKYDKIYIGREDKENICKIENADVFVDDDLKITARVQSMFDKQGKGITYLTNTNYNRHFEEPKKVKRIDDFTEIVKDLKIELHSREK